LKLQRKKGGKGTKVEEDKKIECHQDFGPGIFERAIPRCG
jgi:hypothetical protein